MHNITVILYRIVAVFVSQALKVVGAGTIVGIETWKSLLLASSLDPKHSRSDLNEAYRKIRCNGRASGVWRFTIAI